MKPGRVGTRFGRRGPAGWLAALILLGGAAGESVAQTDPWAVSLQGMTGLVFTPTADIMADGTFRVGYAQIDKKWALDLRDLSNNEIYFLSFGFLPWVEVSLRGTIFPNDGVGIGADQSLDRMGSGRVRLLREKGWRPALAVGIDDAHGTRRFHSLYAVTTKHFETADGKLNLSTSIGYGSDAMDAQNYLLKGWFGGVELKYADFVSGVLEFDTEKWNTSTRLVLFRHLAAHLAFLNLETPSGGVSWTQRF